MPKFRIVTSGEYRETYEVEAADEDTAKQQWHTGTLVSTDASMPNVYDVEEIG